MKWQLSAGAAAALLPPLGPGDPQRRLGRPLRRDAGLAADPRRGARRRAGCTWRWASAATASSSARSSASLLAQLITTGESPDLHPYRPTRFAEGALTRGLYAGVIG